MLFTWLMLAGFIFLFTPQKLTNNFQFVFARLFRWPLSIGRNISLSVHAQLPSEDVVSRRRYNQLQNHLTNITEQRDQEHKKVEKLSRMRDRAGWESMRFVLADVITGSEGTQSELIINRGENDGLIKGKFVLGDNSIIGTISEVSSRTSRVKLVTDSSCKIAIKTTESNVESIMQGSDDNFGKVRMVNVKHKVRVGETIKAATKPGLLDVPVIVGKVAECKRDEENPLLWDITVKPVCEIDRLKDVAVIVMNSQ